MITKQQGMSLPSFPKFPLVKAAHLSCKPCLVWGAACCFGGGFAPLEVPVPWGGWCRALSILSSTRPTSGLSPQQIPTFPLSWHGLWSRRCEAGCRDTLPARTASSVTGAARTSRFEDCRNTRQEEALAVRSSTGGTLATCHGAGTTRVLREMGSRFKSHCRKAF